MILILKIFFRKLPSFKNPVNFGPIIGEHWWVVRWGLEHDVQTNLVSSAASRKILFQRKFHSANWRLFRASKFSWEYKIRYDFPETGKNGAPSSGYLSDHYEHRKVRNYKILFLTPRLANSPCENFIGKSICIFFPLYNRFRFVIEKRMRKIFYLEKILF